MDAYGYERINKREYNCKPWAVITATIVCSLIELILGCVSIVFGAQIITKISNGNYSAIFSKTLWIDMLPALLILLGVFMIVIVAAMLFLVFFQFVSNRAMKRSILKLTFLMLVILAIADIIAVIIIFVVKDSSLLRDSANVTFKNYLSQEDAKKSWNHVQEQIQCCGVTDFNDYATIFKNSSVPVSCCNTTAAGILCSRIVQNATEANISGLIFSKGCVSQIHQLLFSSNNTSTITAPAVGGSAGSLLFLIILACIGYCCCKNLQQSFSGYKTVGNNS